MTLLASEVLVRGDKKLSWMVLAQPVKPITQSTTPQAETILSASGPHAPSLNTFTHQATATIVILTTSKIQPTIQNVPTLSAQKDKKYSQIGLASNAQITT